VKTESEIFVHNVYETVLYSVNSTDCDIIVICKSYLSSIFYRKNQVFPGKSDLLCLLRVELLIVQIVENLNVIYSKSCENCLFG
jgi:hypothetical protein